MNPAIVIPVFNNARSIADVIEEVRAALAQAGEHLALIVIDDGSTDGTAAALAGIKDFTLLRHTHNRGKGAALLTAFRHAQQSGFTHIITVDADGQHYAPDVLTILATSRQHPADLIIGERDMEAAGAIVPLRSKKGRNAARFWLRIETGQDIPDSQCGLRVYPLALVLAVPQRFVRYDFETEILARLAWGGIRVRCVPAKCIYFPPDVRVSHFRPIIDTLRGVRTNIFLVSRRLIPIPFRRLIPENDRTPKFGRWWKRETWRNAIAEALRTGSTNSELATAFALGIFVGLTPLYMLQTILAIYFARRLHLNVLAAVIGSQISIPPLAPLWIGLSYGLGSLLVKGKWALTDIQGWSWDSHISGHRKSGPFWWAIFSSPWR